MIALSLRAGVAYAAFVFIVGVVFGTLRILIVVPRAGAVAAVVIESPFMLIASWLFCVWIVRRYAVSPELSARAVMGAAAFVVLMVLELGLSVLLFHHSVAQHFATFTTAEGIIGLAAQVLFALMPLIQASFLRATTACP